MKTTEKETVIDVPTKEITPAITMQPTTTPATLLEMAVSQGADLDRLEKLMDMQLKWEANEARKSYHAAMTEFKKNPPEINKDKTVKYGQTEYNHASLANVTEKINKCLAEHGLSAAWRTGQSNGITVTCIITHELGHSESTSLTTIADTSGGKNNIQGIGSTISYLQRYTILALTGLATKDTDNDGINITPKIDENQEADLIAMLTEKNVPPSEVLKMFNINKLEDLTIENYKRAVKLLKDLN